MKVLKYSLALSASFCCLITINFAYAGTPFLGSWYSYDGSHHKPRSIVRSYRRGKTLVWRITKVFPNKKHPERRCIHCRGKLKNKPLVGMTILSCPFRAGRELKSCRIFNPDNGKYYSSQLWLNSNNKILNVRAYIEIPILGKTVQWRRVR